MHDLRRVVKHAEADGCSVERAKRSNHIKFRNAKGHLIAVASGTASDWRSVKNLVAQLRAAGVKIPNHK